AVNLSAAIIIACTTFKRRKLLYITLCLPLVSLFALALSRVERVDQYFLRKYYYYYLSTNLKDIFSPNDTLPVVERIRSPYQKIDLVPSPVRAIPVLLMEAYSDKYEKEPNFPKYINLFIEGDFQVNSNMEEVYHEYFAHVPVILHQKIPKNILVLGAGDGLLNRELLKYPESRITQVELDPKMAAIAKTNPLLKRMNKGALEDPRVEILLEDAFQFLRRDRRLYDAVYIDFPNPVSYSLAKLYSKEFFQFLQRRLSPGGFVAINSAGIGYFKTVNDKGDQEIDSENTDWPIYYQTLRAAGFGTILPYISNFETQNDMVEPVLEKIGILQPASPHVRGDGKEEKLDKETRRSIITQVSQEQRSIMQHGFIFAKKETNPVQKKYIDFGITTHVLTEKRFYLAFAIPFPLPENRGKVNSIMKPAFPNLPFTYIRLPF
ncbi:MAG: spermidine synthase, partial [Nitrospinota bacterium]